MKRQGFTRVEVCSVLAVTGVLCLALLPAFAQFSVFTRARENARRSACQSNLKQIALGIKQYVQDYDEKFPTVTSGNGTNSYSYGWADSIQPYIRSLQIFQCPSEKHKSGINPKRAGYTDYWYNRNLSRVSELNVKFIASTLLAGDGDGGAAQSNARYAINAVPRAWASTTNSPARRHLDGANYAYTDGHVKWLKPQRVTTGLAAPAQGRHTNTFRVK